MRTYAQHTHTHTHTGDACWSSGEYSEGDATSPGFCGCIFFPCTFSCNKGVPRILQVHLYEESELGSLFSSVSTYTHTYTHTLTLTHKYNCLPHIPHALVCTHTTGLTF
jgi:hypothetical protein